MGRKQTGLTIFEPDEGLDEGPVILQRTVDIGPDDTLGSLYFDRLFPMGVDAMRQSVGLVRDGKAQQHPQNERNATYESSCKKDESQIDRSNPHVHGNNNIRTAKPHNTP